MSPEDIERLTIASNKLKKLLDDPHPGLGSWVRAVQITVSAIADFEDA